jgi:hypothetical protein
MKIRMYLVFRNFSSLSNLTLLRRLKHQVRLLCETPLSAGIFLPLLIIPSPGGFCFIGPISVFRNIYNDLSNRGSQRTGVSPCSQELFKTEFRPGTISGYVAAAGKTLRESDTEQEHIIAY